MENSIDKSIMESIDKINALNNEYEYKCACALLEATNRAKLIQENCLHEENLNQFTIMQEAYQYYMESDDEEDDDEDDDNEESSDNNGGIGKWATSKKMKKSVFGTSNEDMGTRITNAIPRLIALIVRTIKNIINPTTEKVKKTATDASAKAAQVEVEGASPEEVEKKGGSKAKKAITIGVALVGVGGAAYGITKFLKKRKEKNNAANSAEADQTTESESDDGVELTEEERKDLADQITKYCNEAGIDEADFAEAFMLAQLKAQNALDQNDAIKQNEELVKKLIDDPNFGIQKYQLSKTGVHLYNIKCILVFPTKDKNIFVDFKLQEFHDMLNNIKDTSKDHANDFSNIPSWKPFYENPTNDTLNAYINSLKYNGAIANNCMTQDEFNGHMTNIGTVINDISGILEKYNNQLRDNSKDTPTYLKNIKVLIKLVKFYSKDAIPVMQSDFEYWDKIYNYTINSKNNLKSTYEQGKTTLINNNNTLHRQNGTITNLEGKFTKNSVNVGRTTDKEFNVSASTSEPDKYIINISNSNTNNVANYMSIMNFICSKLNAIFKATDGINYTAEVRTNNPTTEPWIVITDNDGTVSKSIRAAKQTAKNKITDYIRDKLKEILGSNVADTKDFSASNFERDAENLKSANIGESYKIKVPVEDMFNCNWYSYIGTENADAVYGSAQKITYNAINEHDITLGRLAMNMLRYAEASGTAEHKSENWYCEFSNDYTMLKNEFGKEFINSYVTLETSSVKDIKEKYDNVCTQIEDLNEVLKTCNCKNQSCTSCDNAKDKLNMLNKTKSKYEAQLKHV